MSLLRFKTSKKTRSRRKRRKQKKSVSLVLPGLLGSASLAALAVFGFIAYADINTLKPDEMGCFDLPDQASTTVLVDSSSPHMDKVQGADFIRAIKRVYDDMHGNEKLQIINTELDQIGSIPNPVISVCAPAKLPVELEAIGASVPTQAFLDRAREQVFETKILPALEAMASESAKKPQSFESPILEQIQSLSRLHELQNGSGSKRLIVVSDLLQNTHEAQFCQSKGHMPRFKAFKDSAYFERVRPQDLSRVDVKILMLIRPGYGAYCKGEDELRAWWSDYFAAANVSQIEFIRLRFDASGGQ